MRALAFAGYLFLIADGLCCRHKDLGLEFDFMGYYTGFNISCRAEFTRFFVYF